MIFGHPGSHCRRCRTLLHQISLGWFLGRFQHMTSACRHSVGHGHHVATREQPSCRVCSIRSSFRARLGVSVSVVFLFCNVCSGFFGEMVVRQHSGGARAVGGQGGRMRGRRWRALKKIDPTENFRIISPAAQETQGFAFCLYSGNIHAWLWSTQTPVQSLCRASDKNV